ncbi:hypothetical protein V7112_19405 [Bacillus sp. JJ1566]|uniref:DUF6904 family protein n=1 Tax=Bacillus sp. JJ1566 TaxID=3122961 RepID=UPI002FFF9A4C
MIFLENTPNLTGVSVYGDQFDLDKLYDSLHTIVGEEGEYPAYESARLRVLGVCYDIRHAIMGDRKISLIDNGITPEIMKFHSVIAPKHNAYLGFNVLWPELLFVTMALNDFIKLYARKVSKGNYYETLDHRAIWDSSIASVRSFQAAIATHLLNSIPETSHVRILRLMNPTYNTFGSYATQYLDKLNGKFIRMTKEKREKNITVMAKRIAEQGDDYQDVKSDVLEAAREYNCSITEIQPIKDEYPDDFDW